MSAASPGPHGHTVLVVDDDAAIRALLVDVLQDDGHRVETAADSATALQRLIAPAPPAEAFCAVVLDLSLPTIDGMEVLGHLQAHGVAVPAIVASANPQRCAAAVEAGAAAGIAKPFDIDTLATEVRATLAEHCRQRHL